MCAKWFIFHVENVGIRVFRKVWRAWRKLLPPSLKLLSSGSKTILVATKILIYYVIVYNRCLSHVEYFLFKMKYTIFFYDSDIIPPYWLENPISYWYNLYFCSTALSYNTYRLSLWMQRINLWNTWRSICL